MRTKSGVAKLTNNLNPVISVAGEILVLVARHRDELDQLSAVQHSSPNWSEARDRLADLYRFIATSIALPKSISQGILEVEALKSVSAGLSDEILTGVLCLRWGHVEDEVILKLPARSIDEVTQRIAFASTNLVGGGSLADDWAPALFELTHADLHRVQRAAPKKRRV